MAKTICITCIANPVQKQPPDVFCQKWCNYNFFKFQWKRHVLEPATFLKTDFDTGAIL